MKTVKVLVLCTFFALASAQSYKPYAAKPAYLPRSYGPPATAAPKAPQPPPRGPYGYQQTQTASAPHHVAASVPVLPELHKSGPVAKQPLVHTVHTEVNGHPAVHTVHTKVHGDTAVHTVHTQVNGHHTVHTVHTKANASGIPTVVHKEAHVPSTPAPAPAPVPVPVPIIPVETKASPAPFIPILRFEEEIKEGSYHSFEFDAANGIHQQENTTIEYLPGGERHVQDSTYDNYGYGYGDNSYGNALITKKGSFSYISPEGKHISMSYIADKDGFRPTGTHLPTPPSLSIEHATEHVTRAGEASLIPSKQGAAAVAAHAAQAVHAAQAMHQAAHQVLAAHPTTFAHAQHLVSKPVSQHR